MAVIDNLIGYWSLDEASGNALDAHGSNDLTETSGTIASATGKVGNARDFEAADTELFLHSSNADLTTGDIDFSIALWINAESLPGGSAVYDYLAKFGLSAGGQAEYLIGYNDATDRHRIVVRNAADSANVTLEAANAGAASTATWYFIVAWHDSVNNTLNIQVNNGTVDSVSHTVGVNSGTDAFAIGARSNSTSFFDGLIDEVGFWKKCLGSDERTWLYNSGNGRSYADIVGEAGGADAIAITSPEPWDTLQRDGSDEADIAIAGTYSGTPAAIEASFNGGSYATIDASPSGGTFSGTLSGQAVGRGTLTVRFTDDTDIVDTVTEIGIGDVFVIAGQSNASGRGTNPQSYTGVAKAAVFNESGSWAEGNDPISTDTTDGSLWPLLASLIIDSESIPVGFIAQAAGGTGINATDDHWVEGGSATPRQYEPLIATIGSRTVKAVLWFQGEREVARGGTAVSGYETNLAALIANFKADITGSPKTVVFQTAEMDVDGATYTAANLNGVRLGQAAQWGSNADCLRGPVLHDLNLTDDLHLISDAQLQAAADRLWLCLDEHFYGAAAGSSRGPVFVSASINVAKTEVTVVFDQTLKTGDTFTIAAWEVKDDGTPVTVDSVDYHSTDDDSIVLVLESAASGDVTVSLGSADKGAGSTMPASEARTLPDTRTIYLPVEPFIDEDVTALTIIPAWGTKATHTIGGAF